MISDNDLILICIILIFGIAVIYMTLRILILDELLIKIKLEKSGYKEKIKIKILLDEINSKLKQK